jgi:two-component system, OmpR family, KDP operon response regulator KdpE
VRAWSQVPIVVLSARSQEEQKVAALDAGADDYVTKPFGAAELMARLRAALRRDLRGTGPEQTLAFGALRVDLARREAQRAGQEVHLTPLEFRVLACLARHLGSIVMQRQLIREVWGPERQDDSRSLRVCIKNLRAKLEPDPRQPRYLLTETGLGYRLRADEEGGGGETR